MYHLKSHDSIRLLTASAVCAALVFLATSFTKVPIPLGYAHLGDGVIFLISLWLPRRYACAAAAVGSAMADFLGGFPLWVVPTFLIKFGMAYIVSAVASKGWTFPSLRVILAFVLSSLWLTVGYVAAGALLYGSVSVGLTSAPGLLMEGAVNTVAALAVGMAVFRKVRSEE